MSVARTPGIATLLGVGMVVVSSAVAAEAPREVRDLIAHDRVDGYAPVFTAAEREAALSAMPRDEVAGSNFGSPGSVTPMRAFIYSALVPGLGQLAQGSATGYAYLAVEAVGWTGYFTYDQKGKDGEEEYRRFADQHYSRAQYDSVVAEIYREYESGTCLLAGSDTLFECIELAGYFSLDTDTHSGHYYEDIGKLDKYIFGWHDWADTSGDGQSDYDPSTSPVSFSTWSPGDPWPPGFPELTSDLRGQYQDLRRSANRDFAHSTDFAWVLLLNRVVSAFHAAWMANRDEGSGAHTELVIEPVTPDGRARLALARRF